MQYERNEKHEVTFTRHFVAIQNTLICVDRQNYSMIRNSKRVIASNICMMSSMKYENHQLKAQKTWSHVYKLCWLCRDLSFWISIRITAMNWQHLWIITKNCNKTGWKTWFGIDENNMMSKIIKISKIQLKSEIMLWTSERLTQKVPRHQRTIL